MLNQIIKEHLNWHANASKAGFIAVRRLYYKLNKLFAVAENVAKNTNKDSILLLKKEYTMKSALDLIETWIKISGYPYRHEVVNNGENKHSCVIQHDMAMTN